MPRISLNKILSAIRHCTVIFALNEATAMAQTECEPSLDGICKKDPLPPGYVPVGELDSPECKPLDAGGKSAWLIDKVRNKIVSCAMPNYASGFPPAISYMVCQRVNNPNCPPTLDGSPNAYELTQGTACKNTSIKEVCAAPSDLYHNDFFLYNDDNSKDYNSKLKKFILSIDKNSNRCLKPPHTSLYHYIDELLPDSPTPLCMQYNDHYVYRGGRVSSGFSLITNLYQQNQHPHSTRVIVIRRFFSADCPPLQNSYGWNGLNAIVVQQIPHAQWKNKNIFACKFSVMDGLDVYGHPMPQYHVAYHIDKRFHDNRCGTAPDNNAFFIRFSDEDEFILE